MKISIELEEDYVKTQIDQLLGKRITEITDDYIFSKVEEIIDKKLDRVNVDEIITKVAKGKLDDQFGSPGVYNNRYREMLRDEACKILNSRLDRDGLT